jgi:hypothetical protein
MSLSISRTNILLSNTNVLLSIISLALTLLIAYGVFQLLRADSDISEIDRNTVVKCIDNYKKEQKNQPVEVDLLYKINGFCYDTIGSQLKLDQEVIRRDTFKFQRNENIIMLFMVVTITLSGVVLAGLQLLASYKLALLGRGELAGGVEASYSAENISFKTSVVGVAILAISFAFFMLFVYEVYTIKEISSKEPAAANAPQPAAPNSQRILYPLLSPANPTGSTGQASKLPDVRAGQPNPSSPTTPDVKAGQPTPTAQP